MIISTFILRRSHDTFVLLFLLDMMAFYNPIFNHTIFTGSAGTVLPVCKAWKDRDITTFHQQRFPRSNNIYMWKKIRSNISAKIGNP